MNANDMINNPAHYQDKSGIECIEIAKHMGFCGGNCFKYLYRAGKKGDLVEDLKKARKYAEWAATEGEKTPLCVFQDITKVADCRQGYVSELMYFVALSRWNAVIRWIDYYFRELKVSDE